MPRIFWTARAHCALGVCLFVGATASQRAVCWAAEDETSAFQVEEVVRGLDNPCGLAVLPGSFRDGHCEILVSDSGAGRIVRLNSATPQQLTDVVTGFPVRGYGDPATLRMGPSGMSFIAPKKFAVAAEGPHDGQRTLAVFRLPDDGTSLTYDKGDQTVLLEPTSSPATSAADPFGGVVRVGDALLVAARREQGESWIFRARIDANRLAGLQAFIAAEMATETPGSTALVLNPKPGFGYLVGAQMGLAGQDRDSALAFYGPSTGRVALALRCPLYDVVALAYSPSAQLYAADFAWGEPTAGGVYRIDQTLVDGVQACRPVKIADVQRPSSLLFAEDGALWVASFGPSASAQSAAEPQTGDTQTTESASALSPTGALFRITGPF